MTDLATWTAVAMSCADASAAFRRLLDLVQRKTADIDELARGLDLQLHQIEQIRSACDRFGARLGQRGGSSSQRFDALICERFHDCIPAACLIAATMFG